MAKDGMRLGDVVGSEIEQLERYGEAAEEYFHTLSEEIRGDFSASLQQILSGELASFQQSVNRTTASSGYGQLGNILGGVLGDTVGGLLPDSLFGDVFGAAFSAAIRTVAMDVARTGTVNVGKAVNSANRSGGAALDRDIRNMSRGQQSAEMLAMLRHGQRNL